MNTLLLYILTTLLPVHQTNTSTVTRTYKFEHISDTNNLLADYIQLVTQNDSIIKGTYYGNDFGHHFIADLKFNTKEKNNLNFELMNYKFCRENSAPFQKNNFYKIEKAPFELAEGDVHFSGIIFDTQLNLKRTFWFYSSRFDKMSFILEKEE